MNCIKKLIMPGIFCKKYYQKNVINWQEAHGRHELPWQINRSPYHIWLSEIMLQQTTVKTVIPYYQRFLHTFPTVNALAHASISEVMAIWSGLGYYSRAKNVHAAAIIIVKQNEFPQTVEEWQQLPGIGLSTAAAISVFAQNKRAAILDGNVKRLFTRIMGVTEPINTSTAEKKLWQIAINILPKKSLIAYTQGIMDLGNMICTRTQPKCDKCPISKICTSYQKNIWDKIPMKLPKKPATIQNYHLMCITSPTLEILFFTRPEKGIWGGLCCLPEAKEIESLSLSLTKGAENKNIHHQITHRKLEITISFYHISKKKYWTDYQWLNHEDALKSGIPKPIRYLLEECWPYG